jgi:hypothetical protein
VRADIVGLKPFEPVEPIELVDRIYIASFNQEIVYLLLKNPVFSYDAVQYLLEEHDEASPVVHFLIDSPQEG